MGVIAGRTTAKAGMWKPGTYKARARSWYKENVSAWTDWEEHTFADVPAVTNVSPWAQKQGPPVEYGIMWTNPADQTTIVVRELWLKLDGESEFSFFRTVPNKEDDEYWWLGSEYDPDSGDIMRIRSWDAYGNYADGTSVEYP